MKTEIAQKLVLKDVYSNNEKLLKSIEYYSHLSDIIERTYTALGRNKKFEITNSSSINVTINTNGFSHQLMLRTFYK